MLFCLSYNWNTWLVKGNLLVACILTLLIMASGTNARPNPHMHRIDARNHLRSIRSSRNTSNGIWQPKVGAKWQIQLVNPVQDISMGADIFDIDLFDNTAATISKIHKTGAKAICYFSAGSYEDWRPDASKFLESDMGDELDGWPGERWLNVKSANVRTIMKSRLDLAVKKGCDGVDPDNIDAYGNDSGLDLTKANSIDYVNFLASEAHSRGLSIGLKNGGEIIPDVIGKMQWSVNEQCAQYDECDVYAAFTEANKPVFHIEYSGEIDSKRRLMARVTNSEKSTACNAPNSENFSTVIKNMDLDAWVEYC
ncbi:hypothetical protein N7462_000432 [Penicillium macrosclerotiorum]|uniref:uncharacterized protein n=1 Tax=Penicillium macrosclerotiorum TaxID=303699 RepID=UPI002547A7C3|nr:uncharacterized protein N7462_000432 [Penicillium macrosclerotiorum]KAJ5698427.1 hypothetical protein N7462_000432 [Penicillium macrosclerotiorum]